MVSGADRSRDRTTVPEAFYGLLKRDVWRLATELFERIEPWDVLPTHVRDGQREGMQTNAAVPQREKAGPGGIETIKAGGALCTQRGPRSFQFSRIPPGGNQRGVPIELAFTVITTSSGSPSRCPSLAVRFSR